MRHYMLIERLKEIGSNYTIIKSNFVNIKEGTGGTDGLCPIVSVKENAGVYSLKGNKLKNPQQGINIIKMEDGTTKKMYVK